MAVKIELKRSSVPGKIPTTASLDLGELAINTYDGAVYLKQEVNTTQSIVTILTTAYTGSFIQSASYAATASWAIDAITASYALNGGKPAGTDTQLQFNSASVFSGSTNLTFDYNTNRLQLTGNQTISASGVDLSALDIHAKDDGLWTFRTYNDTYSSSSIGLASWIDNSGISFLGTETDKPLHLYNNASYYNPTLIISSSGVTIDNILTVNDGITGSLYGTSSWAENAQTASYVTLAQTASYVENAQTASNILGGKATHVPFFKTDTSLATSSLYQSGSTSIIINQDANTTANPEALYVWQPHPTSINVISGKGDLDNYLQLNIQNTNQGEDASSDIVATADNGSEFDNYIDMGINSQAFNGFLGGPNDSYLYSHGHNMWLGNINDGYSLHLFNSSSINPLLTLTPSNTVSIPVQLTAPDITGSLEGTASWARNAISSSHALNADTAAQALTASFVQQAETAISASHAVNADFATYAANAGIAANGGVTQIVAGSGIALIPSTGLGAVTIISSGGGSGVTVISGSNVTQSFNNLSTWVFNHDLGVRTPVIQAFDDNYNQIIPQSITLTDTTSSTLTFPVNKSGFAIASIGGVTGNAISSSYSLFSTYATTASYYQETDPVFVARSASLATTGSNVFRGNQTITGSLTITGSNTLIGTKIITGSVFISGSKTIIGNNTVTGSMLTTGSIVLVGNQTITGSLTVSGSGTFTNIGPAAFTGSVSISGSTTQTGNNTLIGDTILSGSIGISGSSTIQGITTMSGSLNISGSTTQAGNNTLIGTTTLTGSIFINGNIIPQISASFDLGSQTNPWRTIYLQSGSISIRSDIPGNPDGIISNTTGNISIAAAGFQITSGSTTPLSIDTAGKTVIRVPNLPAGDIGGLSIIGSSTGVYQGVTNAGGLLHLTSNDGQSSRITSDAYGTAANAAYVGRKARGTAASPLPVQSGDVLTRISSIGWTGTDYGFTMSASLTTAPTSIDVVALENYTTSSFGSRFDFYSVPTGSTIRTLSAQINTTGITIPSSSRLFGTASWASNAQTASFLPVGTYNVTASWAVSASQAVSASFATTASYVLNAVSSSFASTASYVTGSIFSNGNSALSSSYAVTASFVTGSIFKNGNIALSSSYAVTASYVLNAISSSFASTSSYVLNAVSSSFASTASYVVLAQTASYVLNAQTASYVLNAVSSSFASTASFVRNAQSASYVLNAVSSSFATTASYAVSSSFASTASYINPLNQDVIITGSLKVSGSLTEIGNAVFSGSVTLNSGSALNINDGFYVNGNKQFNYAQFANTASVPVTANVSASFKLPLDYHTAGVSVVSQSRITFANTGLYNIHYSATALQGSTTPNLRVWFKKTGSNIDNSGVLIQLQNNTQTLITSQFSDYMNAGEYIELWYNSSNNNTSFPYTAAGSGFPATPSIIVTVTQIA